MSVKQPLSILITGATTGIGRHAALHLAKLGHHVLATGRRADALAGLAAEASREGLRLDVLRLDVTERASIEAAVGEALRLTDGRGIDALINNAGYGHAGPTTEISDEDVRRQFETNVFALLAVTRAFVPQLRARAGRLLNVSSVGGRVTFPFFGVYNATKYAVEALSDALRMELAPWGVRVVLIEPGPIRSEFADRAAAHARAIGEAGTSYGPVFERMDDIKAMTDKQSAGPEVVSRAIERALTSRRPRARYVMPFSSRLLLALLNVLPTGLSDLIIRASMGLTRKGMRLDRAAARPDLLPAR